MSAGPLVRCSCCGEMVAQSELEFAFKYPDAYHALEPDERAAVDTFCEPNFCVIGGRRLFVRGLVPLQLREQDDDYCIGAWAELAQADWLLARTMWDEEGNDRVPEFDGVLANHLPHTYELSTLGLSVRVQLHDESRPSFRLYETGHPLEAEQRDGISAHRALHFTGLLGD
ncbi:MAG: DUF2199 domain-containing protein [Lysobacter sp.]|nr:DUF2199 domain-containing protein [Lysobacter sp.]